MTRDILSSGGSRGGAGSPAPPRYFYTKLRPEGPKKIFWRPGIPLVSGSGWPPPPHLNVWIRHCYHLANLKQLPMALTPFVTFQLHSRMHYRYRVQGRRYVFCNGGGGGIIAGVEGTSLVGGSNLEARKRYFLHSWDMSPKNRPRRVWKWQTNASHYI